MTPAVTGVPPAHGRAQHDERGDGVRGRGDAGQAHAGIRGVGGRGDREPLEPPGQRHERHEGQRVPGVARGGHQQQRPEQHEGRAGRVLRRGPQDRPPGQGRHEQHDRRRHGRIGQQQPQEGGAVAATLLLQVAGEVAQDEGARREQVREVGQRQGPQGRGSGHQGAPRGSTAPAERRERRQQHERGQLHRGRQAQQQAGEQGEPAPPGHGAGGADREHDQRRREDVDVRATRGLHGHRR